MNVLQQIGRFLGEKLAQVYGMLKLHIDNREIHRTSEEIRNEITVADIPDEIARVEVVNVNLDGKVDKRVGYELMPSPGSNPSVKRFLNETGVYTEVNVQADWNEIDSGSDSFIMNKPEVYTKPEVDVFLDGKAEGSEIDKIYEDILKHTTDNTRHKTEGEQGKLDNLAEDADATYATKDGVEGITPMVLEASYTEDYKIIMEPSSIERIKDFIKNTTNVPIILVIHDPYYGNENYENYICVEWRHSPTTYRFYFYSQTVNMTGLEFTKIHLTTRYTPATDTITVTASDTIGTLKNPEYFFDRYTPTESYSINSWIESGGIYAVSNEIIQGEHIPAGFTNFCGYVLKYGRGTSNTGCTQVITDKILKKTMFRVLFPNTGWEPWKEIAGGSPKPYIIRCTFPDNTTGTGSANTDDVAAYYNAVSEGMDSANVLIGYNEMLFKTSSVVVLPNTGVLMTASQILAGKENGLSSGHNTGADSVNTTVLKLSASLSDGTWSALVHRDVVDVKTFDYLKVSNIHVVAEYPTDLSSYPDGSIFIKQPAL